nr:probable disease resistance protein At4g27220 isoform X2 [Ipomoea trifida]
MGQVISAAFPKIFETVEGCFGLNESVEDLETQVDQLNNQLADLQEKLRNLEGGGKRRRKQEVDSWIAQATKLINDFPTVKQKAIHGPCWNAWEKYQSIDRVKKMSEAVKDAKNDLRNIGELAVVDVDESTIPSLVVSQLSGKTSNDNLEKLYGCLEDDKVSSIGVYGMGGVGKTTLVKHIHNQILQKMSGVKVYWVTVSQDFSIKKLQDDIAKKIERLKFDDEDDEDQRAAILHQHFVGKKTVLILDDVWKSIPLEKLGNPHRIEGCKFIITSRSLEVCHQIGCQELFKVKTLNENESWDLFKENLLLHGHTVLTEDIEKHAKKLAKKCGGLPLALNTIAASMRGVNDDHSWRTAIKKFHSDDSLQLEDLEKNLFEILKFSYNKLTNPNWKECFLYCCLYREDEKIEKDEIIMKLIAEGLCEDIDEGHSILKKLVDVFLLEGVDKYVKMHDLMREMALKISKFMVKSQLVEIPEEKHWTAELERVSLSSNALKEIPNDLSPICHKLSTLNLESSNNYWEIGIKEIPESFLLYMSQLRVLDLSYNSELKCLPNSISNLENLCGLFLQGCRHISCLPAMKKMKKLRVLNIEDCKGIRELPQDMECLVSLQYLYMWHISKDLEIPKGVISKLRNLKCIQSDNCGKLQSEDLNCLEDLQEFWSWFDELHNFNRLVKNLERLKCYNICVSSSHFYMQSLPLGSNVKKVDFMGINFKLVLLPANITSLHIEYCEGLNGCIADYLQSIMSNLKELYVVGCTEVEWILNSEQIIENASNTGATPFKSLEVLDLWSLPNLISVCKGEDVILPANCTFSSLKYLYIYDCGMKKLLPHALLQNLKNLEKLSVRYCSQLEVVIGGVGGDGEEEGSSNTPIDLPKLKELYLDGLPKLKSICNGREMICPSIENISIWGCTNVKRMPSFLPINEATEQPYIPSSFQKIKLFKDEKEWWESLELHNPNAKHILQSRIEWAGVDSGDEGSGDEDSGEEGSGDEDSGDEGSGDEDSGSSNFERESLPLGSNVKKLYFTGINFTLVLIPANITSLHIEDCEGLNGCIVDYFQSIMSNLRELEVYECTEVEWILNSEQIIENASNTGATPFKSLEVLNL